MGFIGFFILPVTTRYLSIADFGYIALFLAESSILTTFFDLGLSGFAARMIFKFERKNIKRANQYIGIFLFYTVLFSLIGVLIGSIFAHSISKIIFSKLSFPSKIFYYVPIVQAFITSIYGYATGTFVILQKAKKSFLCNALDLIPFYVAMIIGLIFFDFHWSQIVLLKCVTSFLSMILAIFLLKENLGFSVKRLKMIKMAFKYSLPIIINKSFSSIYTTIDKIFLNILNSVGGVGIYSVENKLSTIYSLFSRTICLTVKPEISKRLDIRHERIKNDILEFFEMFLFISITFILFISLFSKELTFIFLHQKFYCAYPLITIFIISTFFQELSGIFNLIFIYKNQTIWFLLLNLLGAVLNIMLNLIMIRYWGYMGAALATCCTSFILLIVRNRIVQKLYKVNYRYLWYGVNFIGVLVLILIAEFYLKLSFSNFIVKLIIIVVYSFYIYKLLQKNDRFRNLLNTLLGKLNYK